MGIPDERIVLMSALDAFGDARNPFPNGVYNSRVEDEEEKRIALNLLYDAKIDHIADAVTVASFLRLLTGRHLEGETTAALRADVKHTGQRLESNAESNVVVYLSGHGGDEFLKFHDMEEMSSQDLAFAIREMELKRRFKELLVIVDTCQAATLANYITSPRVTVLSSSLKGENSYGFWSSAKLGVSVVDRFTYAFMEYFRKYVLLPSASLKSNSSTSTLRRGADKLTLQNLFDSLDSRFLYSTASFFSSPQASKPSEMLLVDFFGPGEKKSSGGRGHVKLVGKNSNDVVEQQQHVAASNDKNLSFIHHTNYAWHSSSTTRSVSINVQQAIKREWNVDTFSIELARFVCIFAWLSLTYYTLCIHEAK